MIRLLVHIFLDYDCGRSCYWIWIVSRFKFLFCLVV